MANYFVQKANSSSAVTGTSVAVTLNGTTAGNMLLVSIEYGDSSSTTISQTISSVTSSGGNSYSVATTGSNFIVAPSQGTYAAQIQSYYATQIKGGNETVTVNLSASANFFVVSVLEYNITGANPLRAVGITPNQSGFTASGNPTPITVTGANSWAGDLIIGVGISNDVPSTAGSGFTSREAVYMMYVEDNANSAGSVVTATATAPSSNGAVGQTLTFATPVSHQPTTLLAQKVNSGASVTGSSLQVTLNTQTAGNMNFLFIQFGSFSSTTIAATVQSVTSSAGNSYQACTAPSQWICAPAQGTTTAVVQSYYAPNIKAGTDTVTVTLTQSADLFVIGLYEYTIPGASPFGSAGVTPTQASTGTGSATPTAITVNGTVGYVGDLVIGIGSSNDGLYAVGTGYNLIDSAGAWYVEDLSNPSTGIAMANATANSQFGAVGQTIVFRTPSTVIPQVPSGGEALLVGSYTASAGSTPGNLSDGNCWTFWNAPGGGPQWVQVDAYAPVKVSRIRFSPPTGGEDLAIGAVFQGSDDPTFSSGVTTFYTVQNRLAIGNLQNEVIIDATTAYRYYRWTTVDFATIADLDIYVFSSSATGSVVTPGDIILYPATGNFDLPAYITLSLLNPSPIYYTLDGTTPSTSSHLYTGPFEVSSSCTLKAAGILSGTSGRVMTRPVHIGATEVSVDDLFDSRNYKIWALNGTIMHDPVSGYWYRYGITADTPAYYAYGYSGTSVYRSADLRNWDWRGLVLTPPAGSCDTTSNNEYHIGVHVGYNPTTGKYVAWADSYQFTDGGASMNWTGKTVWTSSSPEGPFAWINTFNSYPGASPPGQAGAGDSYLFVDTDGVTGYFYTTCGTDAANLNNTLFCAKLSSDWLSFSASTAAYSWASFASNATREAPCVIHVGSTYFLMHSNTKGFNSSDCRYSISSNPLGPWTGSTLPFQPAPGGTPDNTTSFDSQDWQILVLSGRQQGFIYHGDRYDPVISGSNELSMVNWKRIRLPVVISGTTMTINWFDAWGFDAEMPYLSGAPAAPSNVFVFTDGTAYWTNNEPKAVQFFVDTSPNSAFNTGVVSYAVPLGQSSISGLPASPVYRVRAVNAFGYSVSPLAVADEPPLGPIHVNPPFLPITFPPGPPTVPAWESGPSIFVPYNGQMQTSKINVASPVPGTGIRPGPEGGPGPADPNLSNIEVQASATGYGPVGRGTIGVGNPISVTPGALPAQLRFYVGGDGKLYALEHQQNITYQVGSPAGTPVQPPVYSPTAPPVRALSPQEPKPDYDGTYYGQKSPQGQWYWDGTGRPGDDWILV